MRKKKNFDKRWAQVQPLLVSLPAEQRGRWRALYPDARALHVELGCGKGRFLCAWAQAHPDILCIGLERVPEALLMAMERAQSEDIKNLRFVSGDAALLEDYFAPGEADRIFVNFCDPWPPRKQAVRRLTHRAFLARYRAALSPGGQVHFKTDNAPLFAFSLEEFEASGARIAFATTDWHHEPGYPGGDPMTEYEQRFSELGVPICRLEAGWEP